MREVLAHGAFRRLFVSQALSTLGDRLVVVVLALYVTDIGSPTDVGLVLAAQTVPFVVLLLIGGVWADRLPRQRVMVVTDLVRAALHAVLAALILTGGVEIWMIVVIEVLFAAAHAFFRPAYSGLVPQTVPEALIQEAQALNGAVYPIASFLGPALGTALVVAVGAGWGFAVDAATFVVSAALLIGSAPRERGEPPPAEPMLAALRAGWREVATRPWVWITILTASLVMMLAYGPFHTLGPTIAREVHGDAALYGVLVACGGAGNLVGSVLAFRVRPRRPIFAGFALAMIWLGNYLLFGLGVPVAILVVTTMAGAAGMTLFVVWWETELAHSVPPAALSRVAAYDWMGSLGLVPLGYILAGPLAERVGAVEVLVGGAIVGLLVNGAAITTRAVRDKGRVAAEASA